MNQELRATARLFDVANCDDAVIDAVEELLAMLKDARRAKAELARLSAGDLRRVLLLRAAERGAP